MLEGEGESEEHCGHGQRVANGDVCGGAGVGAGQHLVAAVGSLSAVVRSCSVDVPPPLAELLASSGEGQVVVSMKDFRLGDIQKILRQQAELQLYATPLHLNASCSSPRSSLPASFHSS